MTNFRFTAIITREGKFYVSDCPELGITSQGLSLDDAIANLKEAIELFLEDEDLARLDLPRESPILTTVEVSV